MRRQLQCKPRYFCAPTCLLRGEKFTQCSVCRCMFSAVLKLCIVDVKNKGGRREAGSGAGRREEGVGGR